MLVALYATATLEPSLSAQTPVCPPTTGAGNRSVLTAQYDNYRDGHNGKETCLYSTALSAGTVTLTEAPFSPLLADTPPSSTGLGINNPIYAQPLYVSGITVHNPVQGACEPCNMIVLVTALGSVYAYNADNGNLLWKRTGTGGGAGTNWLWADDCKVGGAVVGGITSQSIYVSPGLPFAGIVSTPVIDNNPPPPYTYTMFLTSLCQNSTGDQWWIHEIDLAGLASGADIAGQDISAVQMNPSAGTTDDLDSVGGGDISLNRANQLQRPALLEVRAPGATPNPLIYVAFGTSNVEDSSNNPYHGWFLGYTIDSSGAFVTPPSLTFVTTPTGCGGGGGTTQCSAGNGGTPLCDCEKTPHNENAPNWGGHGAGIWMSGKGPAARTDSDGISHAYIGVGNGGFQNSVPVGEKPNWGESILDFHLSPSGRMSAQPSDFFTPHGGPPDCWKTNACLPVIQPSLQHSNCAYDSPGDGTCNYTVDLFNERDWDMAVSGITLFDYGTTGHFLVTVDKAGYGYLLSQDRMGGFSSGDPGNLFPFAAVDDTACPGSDLTCHRVTSLAYYNNTLYLWPYEENLKALQFNESVISPPGSPSIYTDSTGTAVTGSNCDSGSCPCSGGSCFTHSVIPGDKLVANGCSGSSCPIVTAVTSDTQVSVSPPFSPTISQSNPVPYDYSGYFVNPVRHIDPMGATVGYPGGSLVVTSNGTTSGTAVVWASVANNDRTGYLNAYDAVTLQKIWSTKQLASFTSSWYALPTVVHGGLFIPTYNITASQKNSSCTSPVPCLGVLVYQGATH